MKALRARKIARGLKEVAVWVPAHRDDEIREIAAQMVAEHERGRDDE
jgi:hypothetical protein